MSPSIASRPKITAIPPRIVWIAVPESIFPVAKPAPPAMIAATPVHKVFCKYHGFFFVAILFFPFSVKCPGNGDNFNDLFSFDS